MGVINWKPIGGWMGFPYLSQSQGLSHSFALTYKLTDRTSEHWTARMIRFKANNPVANYGAAHLLMGAVPDLMKATLVDIADTVFVPALSSGETVANPKRAIPIITRECAKIVGAKFEVGALSKNVHGKIHNLFHAEERDAELAKAEYKSKALGAKNVFIFDDFITRGATLSSIAQAVQKANPRAKVYGVALAKAERVDWCPNPENDQVPKKWDALWLKGEQECPAAKKG
jgi:hypothetical protein